MHDARMAVVLLSGGMDSAVAAAEARAQGFAVNALSLRYGQRHRAELEAAVKVAESVDAARHVMLDLDLRAFGGSALTADLPLPTHRSPGEIGSGVPATYVPARNTIFLSCALAWAESLGAYDLFIGVNALDYSGYPDCRPDFIEAFERLANVATRSGTEGGHFTVHAPLLRLTNRDIVQRGLALGVDFGMTRPCYDLSSAGLACGVCDACLLRLEGFRAAGQADPAPYRSRS